MFSLLLLPVLVLVVTDGDAKIPPPDDVARGGDPKKTF